ncbi:MAG: hypothetical protein AVDCRST_MAG49-1213 [uncultured Thermomicrobiales bacterium]|uniref:Uncharacterized protein n=1 Tax=uncultured Thermomicrobiales bacterium TaxID=1645740 RepID=A0A6J4UB56_9BACT|nr:MAG: hypothetical protein AVDCRST_MAG49-1213 [uncultured Thermomicrobiales bacterium]
MHSTLNGLGAIGAELSDEELAEAAGGVIWFVVGFAVGYVYAELT